MPIGNRLFSEFLIKDGDEFFFIFVIGCGSGESCVAQYFRKTDKLAKYRETAVINDCQIQPFSVGSLIGVAARMAAVLMTAWVLTSIEAV